MRSISIIILLYLSASAFSQGYYSKELGLRGGYTMGVTFRANIEENLSYEAQLVYRHNGAIFTMIRQSHVEIGMDRHGNWEFIYGAGVHAGFYFTDSYRIFLREIYYDRYMFTPVIGMDGYVGIDYKLAEAPWSFGISYQPHIEVSMRQIVGINLWDFGVHARFRF